MTDRTPVDVIKLFEEKPLVNVCAPMVRYSKLEFRSLVRRYGCDLCFTPMIMADSFVKSEKARQNDFTTNQEDAPLVAQFAANNVDDFVNAAELVSPFSDGVDLNCGCPQKWAMNDGYGAHLLTNPQLIKEIVLAVRNRIPKPFSVSVKIRLKENIEESIEMCRELEFAGASFITVHGRTVKQRGEPVNTEAIKNITDSVNIPVIGNGGVKSLIDVVQFKEKTNCNGVMVAQGILQNPAIFSGALRTPISCVQDWIDISLESPMQFQCFHHHLVFMLEKVLEKETRKEFNKLPTRDKVLESLVDNLDIKVDRSRNAFNKSIVPFKEADGCGRFFKIKTEVDTLDLCDSWFCT